MGVLNWLRGLDAGVGDAADIRAGRLDELRAEAIKQKHDQERKRIDAYPANTMADAVADLHTTLKRRGKTDDPDTEAMRLIMAEAKARGIAANGVTDVIDDKQIASLLQGGERDAVIDYLVKQGGPGVKAQRLGMLAGTNRALADQGTKGALARTGLYSGIGAGGTAGAAGLIELINYLAGGGEGPQEPMA